MTKPKVAKGTIWADKDPRARNRKVVVIGFDYSDIENGTGGRRAIIRRLKKNALDPKGRETSIATTNLQGRFDFVGTWEQPLSRTVRRRPPVKRGQGGSIHPENGSIHLECVQPANIESACESAQ